MYDRAVSPVESNRLTAHSTNIYLAGVPGLEPGPKVLETSMLTIDTIPLCVSEKRKVKVKNLRIFKVFTIHYSPFTIYFLYAAYGSGSGDNIS